MTPLDILIREPRASDHAAIACLLQQLGYQTTPALVLEKIEALLPSPTDKIIVASARDEVVGSISLHALPLFHAPGNLGRITSMVVDERYRGNGVGSALIAAAEHWFRQVGCVKLEVTSGDHRPAAHRFYERHGFLRDGQRLSRKLHS
ncbi:GCN5 family acetyltransferase [Burkholderia paludis]|uniref:GNAT family N-acetyltransferase n=1 Tax=Burkholderia paludis TaxID=1506587 RepID=UPI0004DB7456|nr:GNAT family N-acetyltransferase [Burkholderia paludis]KFG94162.1 GCN5 family acetyltransferase [Burkholderia paludis]